MGWLIPLTLLIVFEAIADIFAKEWSLHGQPLRWTLAIAAYIVANIFWLFALRNGSGLARGGIIFSVGSAILAVVIGLMLYKETVSKIELLGVLLGLVALTLIYWGEA